jgi:hypothetical protein
MSQKETGPEIGHESTVLATWFYQFSRPCIDAVSVITTSEQEERLPLRIQYALPYYGSADAKHAYC